MSPRTRKFAAEAPTAEGDRIPEGQAGGGSPGEAQPAIGSDAAAEAATSTSDAEAAAGTVDVDREGSFVLLVLDGSITAEYMGWLMRSRSSRCESPPTTAPSPNPSGRSGRFARDSGRTG